MKRYYYIPEKDDIIGQYSNLIWEVEGTPDYESELILPRGYIEIIFNFSNDIHYSTSTKPTLQKAPLCSIQGVNTVHIQGFFNQHHHFFGIRLKPIAVKHLLGILPGEITNDIIDLALVHKQFEPLWHELAMCGTFEMKVELIKSLFAKTYEGTDRLTAFFNQLLTEGRPSFHLGSVRDFAYYSNLSIRQLQRKCNEFFGLSPNEFLRYKKFTTAVQLIHNNRLPLTQIAFESQFYDQSHFIRVFRSYAGVTPKEYKKQMGPLPFHIYKK